MDRANIKKILEFVKKGKLRIEEAYAKLKSLPYEDLGFAKLDTHRHLRKGFPEVIYCQGKTISQIKEIVKQSLKSTHQLMATRATPEVFRAIKNLAKNAKYFEEARIVTIESRKPKAVSNKQILVVTAGTADIPVAEEAIVTAEFLGNRVERLYDVGVAGIHRLFNNLKKLEKAQVLIVVAGMEGALASVIGGLVDKPVIAVPTSVGYGASFKGLSALLTMLNSCSPGVAVVNIDNGFGAGCLAHIINQL